MPDRGSLTTTGIRGVMGGVLMGLANLVPGISGGTMLLAAGVYPDFIQGIAEVTTLRFRTRSVVVLASVGCAAAVAILLLAGPVKDLVVTQRWMAYSLFIGLTLGGVPIVREMMDTSDHWGRVGVGVGFVGMAMLAWAQASGVVSPGNNEGFFWMFLAGVAGASAMILPGVSGGYLLLVLGAYVPILGGIDAFKTALEARDVGAVLPPLLSVVVPVGLGVVVGVVVVSNLLQRLLDRWRQPTLGVLLGLLVGAVVGLYPFQHGVPPEVGDRIKGEVMTEVSLAELDPEDWPTQSFVPSALQVGGCGGLVLFGLGLTLGIRSVGRKRPEQESVT